MQFTICPGFQLVSFVEVKELFEQNKSFLNVDYDFEFVLQNSHFYAVYDENGTLCSSCYIFEDYLLEKLVRSEFVIDEGGEALLFLNGYSKRKVLNCNVAVLKTISNYYSRSIYAYTDKKTAMFSLAHAGFKKLAQRKSKKNKYSLFVFKKD